MTTNQPITSLNPSYITCEREILVAAAHCIFYKDSEKYRYAVENREKSNAANALYLAVNRIRSLLEHFEIDPLERNAVYRLIDCMNERPGMKDAVLKIRKIMRDDFSPFLLQEEKLLRLRKKRQKEQASNRSHVSCDRGPTTAQIYNREYDMVEPPVRYKSPSRTPEPLVEAIEAQRARAEALPEPISATQAKQTINGKSKVGMSTLPETVQAKRAAKVRPQPVVSCDKEEETLVSASTVDAEEERLVIEQKLQDLKKRGIIQ